MEGDESLSAFDRFLNRTLFEVSARIYRPSFRENKPKNARFQWLKTRVLGIDVYNYRFRGGTEISSVLRADQFPLRMTDSLERNRQNVGGGGVWAPIGNEKRTVNISVYKNLQLGDFCFCLHGKFVPNVDHEVVN